MPNELSIGKSPWMYISQCKVWSVASQVYEYMPRPQLSAGSGERHLFSRDAGVHRVSLIVALLVAKASSRLHPGPSGGRTIMATSITRTDSSNQRYRRYRLRTPLVLYLKREVSLRSWKLFSIRVRGLDLYILLMERRMSV